MFILKRDVADPKEDPILTFKSFSNGGLLIRDGVYASQEPNVYGKFNERASVGAYETYKLNGQLVTFWTRPQDKPFTYTWVELPN